MVRPTLSSPSLNINFYISIRASLYVHLIFQNNYLFYFIFFCHYWNKGQKSKETGPISTFSLHHILSIQASIASIFGNLSSSDFMEIEKIFGNLSSSVAFSTHLSQENFVKFCNISLNFLHSLQDIETGKRRIVTSRYVVVLTVCRTGESSFSYTLGLKSLPLIRFFAINTCNHPSPLRPRQASSWVNLHNYLRSKALFLCWKAPKPRFPYCNDENFYPKSPNGSKVYTFHQPNKKILASLSIS